MTIAGSDEPRKLSKTEMLERKFAAPLQQLTTPNITVGNVSIVVMKQGPLHRTKVNIINNLKILIILINNN